MDLRDRLNRAYKGKGSGQAERGLAGKDESAQGKGTGRKTAGGGAQGAGPGPAARAGMAGEEGLLKKAVTDRGYRKVAKFLILLGQEEAAKVMRHLKADELEGIVREISTIKTIEKVEAEAIMAEFRGLIERGGSLRGGAETAKEILESAFGRERGAAILKKAVPEGSKPFAQLAECDATQILLILKEESAHVMAIVLPHLEPKLASEVLVRLGEEMRTEVVRRMAKLEKISPETVSGIEDGLRKRLLSVGKVEEETLDGVSALAGILRYVDSDLEEGILDTLDEEQPELSESIREKLFTLDDVLNVRRNDLAEQLRPLLDKDIALFMKGKSEEFRAKILSAVSRERRKMIEYEYEYLGSVKRSDVEAATREFLTKLKRLHETGELVLEDDDDLVE